MMEVLTFNGRSFRDFHTYYDGSKLFDTPEKDVTMYSVVGRNGDLSISNDRYNNVNISVECFITDDFIKYYGALTNYLMSQNGYGRLETTEEPDVYRMAMLNRAINPQTGSFLKWGRFTLEFNCKPQKWLKSGETAIAVQNTKSLINPTSYVALPLIEVVGVGSITINESVLTLANNTSVTRIDCELQDAYENSINRNPDLTVVNGFPTLIAGENNITVAGFTSVKLYPRWWRL